MFTSIESKLSRFPGFGGINAKGDCRMHCPFCGSTKRQPCWINIYKELGYCHVCTKRFRLKELIGHYSRSKLRRIEIKESPPEEVTYIDALHMPTEAVEYLKERNIRWTDILKFKLGYCIEGRFAGRIILPVKDGYIGRTITNQKPKYLNSKGFRSSHTLFNEECLKKNMELLVMVEGPFDCIIQSRYWPTVGLLGHYVSDVQASLVLLKNPKRVLVMMDPDVLLRELKIFKKKLEPYTEVLFVELPRGTDPATVNSKDIKIHKDLEWKMLERLSE